MLDSYRDKHKQFYISKKFDLEDVGLSLKLHKQRHFEWCYNNKNEDYSLMYVLDSIRASFLSPAYSYNNLIDKIIQDVFWDDLKYTIPKEQFVSSGRRSVEMVIELQNCLISIKIALDRCVKLFRLYKNGIAEYSTFGHINSSTNKAKGFIGRVIQDKETDDIMQFVYNEYIKWIDKCVKPRNAIVHYDDIFVVYTFKDFCKIPVFIFNNENNYTEIYFDEITFYVKSFYFFIDEVIKMIYDKITSE